MIHYSYTTHCGPRVLTLLASDIITPPPRSGKDPLVESRHPPSRFRVLMLFEVNLRFTHAYTPQTFIYTPTTNFKLLEITLLLAIRALLCLRLMIQTSLLGSYIPKRSWKSQEESIFACGPAECEKSIFACGSM